ncbi:MAG: aspartate kinase [Sedimenticola sp.]|nr:aspartate kinase [Sedimenticola sp.]
MNNHSVEKIGGTSMSDYAAVRDNIIFRPSQADTLYRRIFVVSAYSGITDRLLEHKKSGHPGVFALFASSNDDESWLKALNETRQRMFDINASLFDDEDSLKAANKFVQERIDEADRCLDNLKILCRHGHFELASQLDTVREMLASLGESHSAWNTAKLLQREGVNAVFIDLSGWNSPKHLPLDDLITQAFKDIDLEKVLPIVTGYAHSDNGLMTTFDRGYSEMTFSRIAVLTKAQEAVIHKEFHLSSADPNLVGEFNSVPIGRTNYDVADQLANLGMEAIHPKAARGLRQNSIPLRVKNTFEPEHSGTLITGDYISEQPCIEIIAGSKNIYALTLFDQEMSGEIDLYDREILKTIRRFRGCIVSKDINANTITHYLRTNLKTIKRIRAELEKIFPGASMDQQEVAIVSAIGSDMQIAGLLAQAVGALADAGINIIAMHQTIRQIDMQFVIDETNYDDAVRYLHAHLVEVHDHGRAIKLAN